MDEIEYGRDEWATDTDAAHAECDRRIARILADPTITDLFLSDLFALERLPDALGACRHLRRLWIGNAEGPDGKRYDRPGRRPVADIAPLASLTDLRELSLADTEVSDIGPIRGLGALTSLDLWGTQVSDIGPIRGLKALMSLDLWGTKVSDIRPIGGLGALTSLELGYTQVHDIGPISGLEALTSLNLVATQVSDIGPIRGLGALTSLDLGGTQVSDIGPISGLEALTSLDLRRTQVSDIGPIRGLGALTSLDLAATQVSDIGPISGLEALTSLDLRRTQVSDIGPISGLEALTSLGLAATKVSDIGPISGLEALTSLDLTGTQVSDLSPLLDAPAFAALEGKALEISDTPLARRDDVFRKIAGKARDVQAREAVLVLRQRRGPMLFLSYKREERAVAERVIAALEARGVRCWFDGEIRAEDAFRDAIDAALEGCDGVLSLWSTPAVRSDWLRAEAQRGLDRGRYLQATLDGTAPPLPFGERQLVDLPPEDDAAWARGIAELAAAARRLGAVETTPEEEARAKMLGLAKRARMEAAVHDGKVDVEETPAGAPKDIDAFAECRRLLGEQAALVDIAVRDIGRTPINFNPDMLLGNLGFYGEALRDEDPDFIRVDPEWTGLAPQLADELIRAGCREHLIALFDNLLAKHDEVMRCIRRTDLPVGGIGPRDDAAAMDAASLGPALDRSAAALASEEAARSIGVRAPKVLASYARRIRTTEDAPYGETAEAREKRLKARRMAIGGAAGVLGALGSAASLTGVTAPEAFAAVLERLGPAWRSLSDLFR